MHIRALKSTLHIKLAFVHHIPTRVFILVDPTTQTHVETVKVLLAG